MNRALASFGAASGDSEPYLCHNKCELGALKAEDGFAEINDFLRENPNEVVLIILQDEIEAADAVDVLEKSHLADRRLHVEARFALPHPAPDDPGSQERADHGRARRRR